MRATGSAVRAGAGRLGLFGLCVLVGPGAFGVAAAEARPTHTKAKADVIAAGREIFNREWLPDDPRGHGGDGLGPVYNDTSCVACHNSGGTGGAGPVSKNIDILNATRNRVATQPVAPQALQGRQADGTMVTMVSETRAVTETKPGAPHTEDLVAFHAGFRDGRTVVLHKFGTDPNYEAWRRTALGLNPFGTVQPQAAILNIDINNSLVLSGDLAGAPINFTGGQPTAPSVSGPAPGQPTATDLADFRERIQGRLPGTRTITQQVDAQVAQQDQQAQQQITPEMRAQVAMQAARAAMAAGNGTGQQMQFREFTVTRSQRNPTPLFGLGLIDAIPEPVIEEAANRRFAEFPEVQGRISRLKDGRVGRLGWKGQTANSEDFVLTACAVELGLEVPGHNQAVVPQAPKYKASGMDLTADQCAALVAYVRALPRPEEREPAGADEAKVLAAGKATFAGIGCASCHSPDLGEVKGIYSDLALHDMGAEMADLGSYNGSTGDDDEPLGPVAQGDGAPAKPAPKGASRQEWRTPPLWGVRDSGPYLHDGRAQTLDQAVVLHGGQGAASAQRFFKLAPADRLQVEAFLKSLTAPTHLARAAD